MEEKKIPIMDGYGLSHVEKNVRPADMEPWRYLLNQMRELVESEEYTYDDVTTALGKLSTEVTHKGRNLLNATNIQEVMQMPMFRSSVDDTRCGDHQ